ncbi:uncharacterized protein LOC122727700 [Dromiciops gliroides]|uniref:uncharacterized protein LOC122727700 n=1 Tax=Dromiciops gliroides TaxID=33562 RepID=UPI001CC4139A|nr:uncharacterized protein LOC122727700 [Dromiciops gliroides]
MLLPLLGICALFGRFRGKSWEPVQGLLTDGCGCGDPRCCGNLFILCLFLLWQVRQRCRGPKKKGFEVSLLKWAVSPWCRLASPVPSPGLSICPCTQKRLEIHVQKLVYQQKWGPPWKLRESWTQFLLSQLSGHRGLEVSGEPGVCAPRFPSTCRCLEEYHKELYLLGGWQFAWGFCSLQAHLLCKVAQSRVLEGPGWMEQAQERPCVILSEPLPVSRGILLHDSLLALEKTSCHSLLSIEGPCMPVAQLVEVPEAQEPERGDPQLASDEGTLATQALRMEEGLGAGEDVLEAGSQPNCSRGESHTYKDASFPWGSALEDADSEASEQELEAAEGFPGTTPLTQPLVQMWEGLQPPGEEESLQDMHEYFPGRRGREGGGTGLMPGQHQHQCSQAKDMALELSHHDMPPQGESEESQSLDPLLLFVTSPEDSDRVASPSDSDSKKVTSTHAVPPKRPTLKKSSRLLLESLLRRKIAHLKWGLPRRIQESEWLFQLMRSSSPPHAEVQFSSPREDEASRAGEPKLGGAQSSCQDLSLLQAASGAPEPALQPSVQFKERLGAQEKEAQKLPVPPRKRKGKKGAGPSDAGGLSSSLEGAKGPSQIPALWGLQELCDEALSRAMLPDSTDCAKRASPWEGAAWKQPAPSTKDSPSAEAWGWRDSQEAADEASTRSRGSRSEPRPGPSRAAQKALEKLGNPGAGASVKPWPLDPCQTELNPKVFQDSQALPWATVCHWSMASASCSQNVSDSGGDTPQSHSSEAHLLPAEQRKRIFRSQGGRIPESGASSYSSVRTKGPFRTAAKRLGMAFMNKMPWSLRQASSATSVSNHNECQEDPEHLSRAGSSGTPQTGLPGRPWDREEFQGYRRLTGGYASLDLERDPRPLIHSFCNDGMGESSAQAPQNEQAPTKSSWAKRLRCLLTRLNFNK